MIYLLIAAGGALGSVARYWLSGVIGARLGETFPWGTLVVNFTGCLAIGFFAALGPAGGRSLLGSDARGFLLVGICGGYTTFSAFSLQTLELLRAGDWLRAGAYVAASVVFCLLGVWAGQWIAHAATPAA